MEAVCISSGGKGGGGPSTAGDAVARGGGVALTADDDGGSRLPPPVPLPLLSPPPALRVHSAESIRRASARRTSSGSSPARHDHRSPSVRCGRMRRMQVAR